MSEIPKGWTLVMFMDIFDIQGGTQPPKSTFQSEPLPGYIRLLQIRDFGERPLPTYVRDTDALKKCTEQDILIARYGASLGRILTGLSGGYNVAMAKIYIPEPINRRFVYYLLRSEIFQAPLQLLSRSAQNGFNKQDLQEVELPIAPLNEQKRIADKLDALLARVEACQGRLDRIPLILKRFRQTVLAAATSGQLTEEWRDLQSTNKMARWVSLEDVASEFSYGSSAKSSPSGTVPVLRMGNIQEGKLDWNNLVFTSDIKEIEKYQLLAGDVLFNRTNSPELVGKTAVYKGERPAIYAGYLIRVRCSADLLPDYLNYCLNSPAGRDYCWQVKSDAISQSNINARKLAAFQFELPPIEEQAEIVRRTEALFAYADRLEAHYQVACAQVDRLTPTLLTKAFRGELVPQDPNDEPASVLLERIGAERAAQAAKPKRTQASRKPTITKMTEESVKEAIRQLPKDKFSFDELRENIPGNYDLLKDILFALLSEDEPSLKQVFDQEEQTMRFVRAGK